MLIPEWLARSNHSSNQTIRQSCNLLNSQLSSVWIVSVFPVVPERGLFLLFSKEVFNVRGAFFVWCSLAFWVVAITVSIAVTVAISIAVTVAISIAILAAVEGLFVIFDVIEDGAHAWEGVFFVDAHGV